MTHGSNTSNNHHPLHPRDDRETLSALFDGELPGDAARFALKRLDHDAGWRDTCGRWLLIGDALRGEATSAAPADFAAGVMRKLAAEAQAAVPVSPVAPAVDAAPARVATRRRWLGGAALAASVAMVAVLVARPFSEPSSTPVQMQVAAGVVAPASAEQGAQRREVAAPVAISAATSSLATPLAAAEAPSAARHRASRPARTVLRSVRPSVDDTATAVAAAEPPAATQTPFHPSTDDIATRPWPRAVLPETGGNFTVGFGATSTPTSSLYPFEPRLPDAATPKPAVTEPQR
jgi:Meckel syndrome type 1 protein